MRILSLAGLGIVGIGFVLAATPAGSTNANPPSRIGRSPAQRAYPSAVQRPSPRRRLSSTASPSPCATNYPLDKAFFVGVTIENNVAGGQGSAVLGGFTNEACDQNSGIGAGADNMIGSNGVDAYSFIGGGFDNAIVGNYAFIGAGRYGTALGAGSFVGAGGDEGPGTSEYANVAAGVDSFVGAGDLNQISSTGNGSFIGGGDFTYAKTGSTMPGNQISGIDSFIGAGDQNGVAANEAFIGGGQNNVIVYSAQYAVLAGGFENTVSATSSFIGSGQNNNITPSASDAVISGGSGNVVSAQKGVVGGGEANEAEGSFTTVPGGYHNLASGNESFAAGSQAQAKSVGSFVWSDYASGEAPLTDKGIGTFVARASGGVYFYSNAGATTGVKLAAGSGAWSSLSDRNAKTGIVPLDDASILSKVASLPISGWQYKTERGVRHVGPMAQDFYAAFGVGEDDRHITSIDEDGVALAAIKALHHDNDRLRAAFESDRQRKDDRIAAQQAEIGALRSEMKGLEAEVKRR